jgi:hypothetical protein
MLDSKLMDIKLSNRKKCIGEYNDLYHIFYPNFSKKYENTYKDNENVFKNYKGKFTHLTEIGIKNENILDLFTNKNKYFNKNNNENNANNNGNKKDDNNINNNNNNLLNKIKIKNPNIDFGKTTLDKKFFNGKK